MSSVGAAGYSAICSGSDAYGTYSSPPSSSSNNAGFSASFGGSSAGSTGAVYSSVDSACGLYSPSPSPSLSSNKFFF